jgi:hypothetical protein
LVASSFPWPELLSVEQAEHIIATKATKIQNFAFGFIGITLKS